MRIEIEREQRFEPVTITIRIETQAELEAIKSFQITHVNSVAKNLQAHLHRELLNL